MKFFKQNKLHKHDNHEKQEIMFMQKVNDYLHNSPEGLAYGELCRNLIRAEQEKAAFLAKIDSANQENPFYTDHRPVNKMELIEL